jgi:DNA-binding CsgD family transcriptional regulator
LSTEEILEVVRGRSSPGIMVLGRDDELIYANQEALKLLKRSGEIPSKIRSLCKKLKAHANNPGPDIASNGHCALLWRGKESLCSIRAFLIGAYAKGGPATHVMVLVERVTEQRDLNLKKAKMQYGLSKREIEVVELVAQGLTNKEIASRLFLSEYTIKDHIKNVMRKMGATSRGEIIYILK